MHAVVLLSLDENDLAGTIFASPPPADEQGARGFVKIVPNAARPDVADDAGLILVASCSFAPWSMPRLGRPRRSFDLVALKFDVA